MSSPSVTFVMAAHNAEKTIREAIESALAQEYDGVIRVLVVDDASTDGTLDAIPNHDGVQVLRNETRLGRSGSRNKALRFVQTDLVAIHDADDVSLPNRLSSSVPLLSDARTVVGTQLLWKETSGSLYEGATWPTSQAEGEKALAKGITPVAHPSMLLPTALIRDVDGYDERFPVAEDLELMLRLGNTDPRVRFISSSTAAVAYRRSSCDSLAYCFRSHYWRSQVLKQYNWPVMERHLWIQRALESFLRQRLRVLRRAARGLRQKHESNYE